LGAGDDVLAAALLELKDAISKTGDERLARLLAAGASFAAETKTVKLLRRTRVLGWRNLIRMRHVTDADSRLDTRHKIQLGGLIIKAGPCIPAGRM
jgi:hypothetical protein